MLLDQVVVIPFQKVPSLIVLNLFRFYLPLRSNTFQTMKQDHKQLFYTLRHRYQNYDKFAHPPVFSFLVILFVFRLFRTLTSKLHQFREVLFLSFCQQLILMMATYPHHCQLVVKSMLFLLLKPNLTPQVLRSVLKYSNVQTLSLYLEKLLQAIRHQKTLFKWPNSYLFLFYLQHPLLLLQGLP